MNFIYDDGGRKAAGYKGNADDCVVRAIAIAAELSYQEVYDTLSEGCRIQRKGKRQKTRSASARGGVYTKRKWFKDYMASIGWFWTPTMGINGCKVHLAYEELPAGRLLVAVAKHYTVVIDRVIHDIFDPREIEEEDGTITIQHNRCVYGYWRSKANEENKTAAYAAYQLAESLRPRKKTKRLPKPFVGPKSFTLQFRPGTFIE